MKKLLVVVALAASSLGFAQSNNEGTIHINLLGGFTFAGSVTDKPDCEGCEDQDYSFASGTYALNVHYGLNENMSVGLGLSTGSYLLTVDNLMDSFDIGATTMSMTNVSAQGRYYFVNNDDLNVYGGANLGFGFANDKFGGFDISTDEFKASGLTYGLNVGLNYYIWGNVGGLVQLGYDRASLSGDYTYSDGVDTETTNVKRGVGGISFMAGLSIKID
ncbi:outer membrane beta-barrel protein [Psychroserpens sp.]|uniref:outer membrane beta-barrel protein n=1 Tax=Psychroserpens sp. TaxID=2020870 RepID=UPI002B26717D|nr:outer membrane beta-barrel protein [Psychroserpens sp.]